MRARFYDPVTFTWLTRDPIGFIDGSNPYQFVGSLPWILDPLGLCGRERGFWESVRDSYAGLLDGVVTGLTLGFVESSVFGEMMGADLNSPAYTAGNMVGDIAAGVFLGAVTGGAGSCINAARWMQRASRLIRNGERIARVRDGVQATMAMYYAVKCGGPSAIADALVNQVQRRAMRHLSRAAGRTLDSRRNPCSPRSGRGGPPVSI